MALTPGWRRWRLHLHFWGSQGNLRRLKLPELHFGELSSSKAFIQGHFDGKVSHNKQNFVFSKVYTTRSAKLAALDCSLYATSCSQQTRRRDGEKAFLSFLNQPVP
jgi:hypothetical protein